MYCLVIQLRRNGLRLKQTEWPPSVHGSLEVECSDARGSNLRRSMRQAVLYVRMGVASRKVGHLQLFEPTFLYTVANGFILRGIQLRSVYEESILRIYEHEQMWLCLTNANGEVAPGIGKRLPEA